MSNPLFAYPSLASLSSNLLVLSQPIHPLLPSIPLLLPLHAIRVAVAWEQVRSSKRTKDTTKGGLKNLVGYLVMAFGGSFLTSLLLRSPPSILLSPLLLPLYTLIYLLLPTRFLLSLVPSLPLNFSLSLLDATNRILSISTLLARLNLPTTNATAASFFLAGLGTVGGGLVCSMFGLWEEEWTVQTPALVKVLSGMEGWEAFLWGGMDFWGAGAMSVLLPLLLQRDVQFDASASSGGGSPLFTPARWLGYALGLQEKDQEMLVHKAVGWVQKGDDRGWTALEARTICTVVLGGLLGMRVVVLYSKAWWKQVMEVTTRVEGKKVTEVGAGTGEKVKVGEVVEATTSSVDSLSPRKSSKVKQRVKKRS
ncbi:hypothetical protein BDY24DRAFT_413830 [Mrakia frigida]|uniref:uncharacterized protein n=1 Tax=Mrakia frigida TaxID=29902 RepID=UPI003FCBF57F